MHNGFSTRAGRWAPPPPGSWHSAGSWAHAVQFYETDAFLEQAIAAFLAEGLRAGDPAVLVARSSRRDAIAQLLLKHDVDFEDACSSGQVTCLEVHSALAGFMDGGRPDPDRFRASIGAVVERAVRGRASGRVRAYGEMVDALYQDGKPEAALQLERLWNELARSQRFSLLCAYTMGSFQSPADDVMLEAIAREHTHCLPAEGYAQLEDEDARAREIVRLQQKALALETEVERRKRTERRLRLALAERKRAEQSLAEARDEAQRANDAKSQFLAVMSHELRTPLNAIMGFVRLLQEEVGGPLLPRQHEFLSRIDGAADHLLALIDRLLRLARIEAGREDLNIEPLDARALAEEAIALVEPAATRKGLLVGLQAPEAMVLCHTDAAKVRQILLNLLANAIKFTSAGGVDLEVRPDGDGVLFSVRDSGIGIAPDDLERVFERFVQVDDSMSRRYEGAGLGLTVSRNLARLLGGELTARSIRGEGSVFELRLPL
ncbi:MAG TPA: ATP-binding protein, partial [Longimicrobiales bacterium]